MTPGVDCGRGDAVVSAIVSGRWEHASDDLRAHATGCETCRELAAIATRLHEDRDAIGHEARLPSAGQVWWRSAVRARLEAQQTAARPLVWLYGAASATALGLLATLIGFAGPIVEGASNWFSVTGVSMPEWRWIAGLADAVPAGLPLVLLGVAAGLLLLMLPILYVALSDD